MEIKISFSPRPFIATWYVLPTLQIMWHGTPFGFMRVFTLCWLRWGISLDIIIPPKIEAKSPIVGTATENPEILIPPKFKELHSGNPFQDFSTTSIQLGISFLVGAYILSFKDEQYIAIRSIFYALKNEFKKRVPEYEYRAHINLCIRNANKIFGEDGEHLIQEFWKTMREEHGDINIDEI